MRTLYSIIYLLLIFALLGCGALAKKSDRPTRNAVAFLETALIPAVLGNLFIIGTSMKLMALIGHYMYCLGMDLVMYSLVNFTNQYCQGIGNGSHKPTLMYFLLAVNSVQLLLNIFFGHAFGVTEIEIDGAPYFKMIPHWGQTLHMIIDYFVFFCVLLIFILAAVKTPKLTRERYTVLLVAMAGVSILISYNILFHYTTYRSIIGFGAIELIIYYFAIRYRPLRLLDKVLSSIISDFSDSFYIFDPNGNCIWANTQGCKLVGITDNNYDKISEKLMQKFGSANDTTKHIKKMRIGEGFNTRFYILEENKVTNSSGRLDGSYLRIQDVTEGEQQLRQRDQQIGQISREAYRDPLTGVGSKVSYIKKICELNSVITSEQIQFAVVMVDMNNLKHINDDYGHKAGDTYIKGCCHLICEFFKHSPVFRIGGDEFVAILQGQDYENRAQITEELKTAFKESYESTEKDPWLRYSAAIGMAENASDDYTFDLVFKRADKAMYEDKREFKESHAEQSVR